MLVWPVVASSSAVEGPRGPWRRPQHLPQAGIVEGLQLCTCEGP